jgi:hypothetical protein
MRAAAPRTFFRAMWTYPPELLAALAGHGIAPRPDSDPRFVRDYVSDLYRFEIRRLKRRRQTGDVRPEDYVGRVIALRKQYWVLTLEPSAWERICRGERA